MNKKFVFLVLGVMFALFVIGLSGSVSAAACNVTIGSDACTIGANTIVQLVNSTYFYNGSSTGTINLNGNNSMIDCNGSTIFGNQSGNFGIYSSGFTNVTVKNCVLQNYTRAIFFTNNPFSTITNNTVLNSIIGIRTSGNFTHSIIERNLVVNTTQYGLQILAANSGLNITNNIINWTNVFQTTSFDGIFIQNAVGINVFYNNILNSPDAGIAILASNNTNVSYNNITSPFRYGILTRTGYNLNLGYNNIQNISSDVSNGDGIRVTDLTNNTNVYNNNIFNVTQDGIKISNASNNGFVYLNILKQLGHNGISVRSSNVTVHSNIMNLSNHNGLDLYACDSANLPTSNNLLYNNSILDMQANGTSIYLCNSSSNIIRNNIIINTSISLIIDPGSNNNSFFNNSINQSIYTTIQFGGSNSTSFLNTFSQLSSMYYKINETSGISHFYDFLDFYTTNGLVGFYNHIVTNTDYLNNSGTASSTIQLNLSSSSMVYTNNGSVLCSNLQSCSGFNNLSLGISSFVYILQNFNLTESVIRLNSPIYFSSSSSTSKHIASNLTQAVNVTTIFTVSADNDISTITLNGIEQNWTQSSTLVTIPVAQLNAGDNTITINYLLLDQTACVSALGAFGTYPALIGLIGTVFLLGLAIMALMGYSIIKSGQEINATQVGMFFILIVGIGLLVIIGIVAISSLCSVGVI